VLVRLFKGRAAWEHQLDDLRARCVATGAALLAFGGEASIDAEMTSLSTVPAGIVTEAFAYLARGGPANLANLLRFVADTVLLEGFGFDPPQDLPMSGLVTARTELPGRPTVAVVTYRANVLAGNTLPVEQLCDAIERRGANARGVYCYSLRNDPPTNEQPALDLLRGADVVVTTTWAAGGTVHEGDAVTATSDGEGWASPLDALDVPVLQGVASTGDTATWAKSTAGLSPLDVALGVAIPEFDGRIIGPPLSFKEVVDDGDQLGVALAAHRAVPDRVERIAGLATRLARLRHLNNADKRVALVLTAYPTKRSRIGNAVALDTPQSLLRLLDALAQAGYKVDEVPEDSDAFMARLADGLTYDQPRLSPAQQAMAVGQAGHEGVGVLGHLVDLVTGLGQGVE
jgi:cobaltochelatase CobN